MKPALVVPPPGPQRPDRYPFVGARYRQYGELPGYRYVPQYDNYVPETRTPGQIAQEERAEEALKNPPKSPGFGDALVPIAATIGAIKGAEVLAPELIGSSKDGGSGLIGVGKDAFGGIKDFFKGATPTKATTPSVNPPSSAASGAATITPSVSPSGSTGGLVSAGSTPTLRLSSNLSDGVTVVDSSAAVPDGYTAIGSTADGGTMVAPTDSIAADGTVDLGAIGQGALGAYQLYQGYKAAKEGNYLGAGLMGAGGLVSLGASGALGATGTEFAGSTAGQVIGPLAGLYGLYQTDKAIGSMPAGGRRNTTGAAGGAAAGAAIGAPFGYVGMGIGALIGGAVGFIDSQFGSSKTPYQMMRDQGRKYLQANGILDQNFQGKLADGSMYDFGKDGKNLDKADWKDPVYGKAAALANVIAATEGLTGKSREAMARLYANAGVSNANGDINKMIENMRFFAAQRGFTPDAVQAQLDKMKEEGQLTQNEYDTFSADKNAILGPSTPRMAPLAPGQQQEALAAVSGKPLPPRSRTLSPGIGLDGRPIAMRGLVGAGR